MSNRISIYSTPFLIIHLYVTRETKEYGYDYIHIHDIFRIWSYTSNFNY